MCRMIGGDTPELPTAPRRVHSFVERSREFCSSRKPDTGRRQHIREAGTTSAGIRSAACGTGGHPPAAVLAGSRPAQSSIDIAPAPMPSKQSALPRISPGTHRLVQRLPQSPEPAPTTMSGDRSDRRSVHSATMIVRLRKFFVIRKKISRRFAGDRLSQCCHSMRPTPLRVHQGVNGVDHRTPPSNR
jgi:hypothetical protein